MKLRVHAEYNETMEFEMDFTEEDLKKMDEDGKFPYMDKVLEQKKQTNGEWDIKVFDEYGNEVYDSWYYS